MINRLKILSQNKLLITLVVIICLCSSQKAYGASLSLLPSVSNTSVGNIISVKVLVNTESKTINNAEATIQFPTDMLDVLSITKSSSIFSLWVEEPSFSNNTGKIVFNGGVPNPGWSGSNGYIASITFKAKRPGVASILFSDGAVRENDGFGTNILTLKNGGVVNITSAVKTPPQTKVPDNNTVISEVFNPSIRFEGNQGILKLSDDKNIINIDYFSLQIDDKPTLKIKKEQLINYEYYLPIQNEGSHNISIVFFDSNGKYTESILSYVSPTISMPILSLSSYEITKGDSIIISGKTDYSNIKVNVILEIAGNEISRYTQTTGLDGSFSITTDNINGVGVINIWAENVLSDEVRSMSSERVYLKVVETAMTRITVNVFYPLLWLILIFSIVSLLFVCIYLGWHKFFNLKKKYISESKEAISEIHKNMLSLKVELKYQLESLEKIKIERNLNKEEEIIFNELQKKVDMVDSFIENKLKNLV